MFNKDQVLKMIDKKDLKGAKRALVHAAMAIMGDRLAVIDKELVYGSQAYMEASQEIGSWYMGLVGKIKKMKLSQILKMILGSLFAGFTENSINPKISLRPYSKTRNGVVCFDAYKWVFYDLKYGSAIKGLLD